MNDRYVKNYRILCIRPGATWQELRQAYKSLVNTWHPDRFQQDMHQRKLAEEKTKEINQSYTELTEYYKKFGALPQATKTTDIPLTEDIESQSAPDAQPVPENQDTEPSAAVSTPAHAETSWRSKTAGRTLAAAALVSAAYFVWQLVPWESQYDPPANEELTNQTAKKQDNENSKNQAVAEKYFSIGSPPGEVYSIQGVPTKTEQDIWYYGNSKVYFDKGGVSRWEESSDNPLRATITSSAETVSTEFFHVGSSKDEVLSAQGTPEIATENVWDYGVSRVYFEKGRVTSWDESPLRPLRARR